MVKKNEKRRQQSSGAGGAARETSTISLGSSMRNSRLSFLDTFALAISEALETRQAFQIITYEGDTSEDLTPPLLEDSSFKSKLYDLTKKIRKDEIPRMDFDQAERHQSSQRLGFGGKTSIDEVSAGMQFDAREEEDSDKETAEEEPKRVLPFIKIVLRRTKELLLFEQRSSTVLRESDEARLVEEDNKFYDYITIGKGRVRRTNTSEAQTIDILYKSRDANTQSIKKAAVVSYVSNFEMFDTYRNLETTTKSVEVGEAQQIHVTTYKVGGVDQFEKISQTNSFKLSLMVTLRMLAGNVFEQQQRRFRNMIMPDPLARDVMFMYSLKDLFCLNYVTPDKKRKAIVDIAFCPGNGDIIAVAYGIYSYGIMAVPEIGFCCIWNIKNPINPERVFKYNMAVVTVQFSAAMPQLLAIGLFDGSTEVRDISHFDDPPIAISQRAEYSSCDPITSIQWLPQSSPSSSDTVEIDPLLSLSQDGFVIKYRVINSPHLLAFPQMQLDRVEGSPEGLYIRRPWHRAFSSRCPQGTNMVLHPRQHDLYFLLTDEGCTHKCSTNYPHQHLEVLQVHNGSVNVMDFSPWSPKVFLTAGNDWYIRIWIEGIFEPLITLKNENSPVLSAAWSKTHSTVIISNTRRAICVWDIRRSVLKPVSYTKTDQSLYTLFKFSCCGRSLAIGNEKGTVMIMGLEEFPFPPHFQYDELELAIYRAIFMKPQLTNELKSLGFFGYPEQRRSRRHRCT